MNGKRRIEMDKKEKHNEPTIANGMDDQEELEQKASKEEIAKGDYTKVVTLSFDEVNPS
jgi:hypothetical protein